MYKSNAAKNQPIRRNLGMKGRTPPAPQNTPRRLPPHLEERNKRCDLLRKFGLGRRRANIMINRSYAIHDYDERVRNLARRIANATRGQEEYETAMLRELIDLLDPKGPRKTNIYTPSPPQPHDINWNFSPARRQRSPPREMSPPPRRYLSDSPERSISYRHDEEEHFNNYHRHEVESPPPIHLMEEREEERYLQPQEERYFNSVGREDTLFQRNTNMERNDIYERSYNETNFEAENYIPIGNDSRYIRERVPLNNDAYKPSTRNNNRYRHPILNIPKPNPSRVAAKRKVVDTIDLTVPSKKPRQRFFHVGGYKLPYVQNNKILPQPESQSYAARFFKKKPKYSIGSCNPEQQIVFDEGDISDDEESPAGDIELDEEGNPISSTVHRCIKQCVIESLCVEWAKIYRPKNYRNWHNWWKDFQWCEAGINKELDNFQGYNVKYNFILPAQSTQQLNKKLFTAAHLALVKNGNNYHRNMRTVYQLMSETFLENLTLKHIEQLLDIIRGIPNHLWMYKLRSMVYLWVSYGQIANSVGSTNEQKSLAIAKEWKSPVFHWLAKQAFMELKWISKIEWSGHKKFFGE